MTRTVALVLHTQHTAIHCSTDLKYLIMRLLKLFKHEAGTRYNPNPPDAMNRNNTVFRYTYPY